MKKTILKSSLLATVIILTGCGGGGSSSSNGPITTRSISGSVIDPEIQGASVSLRCANNKVYNASSTTNDSGKFTIHGISSDIDLSTCTIEASGGIDNGTSLEGLILKAPYKLFNSNTKLFVTPFTTLVASHDSNDIEIAKQEVADFLGSDVNVDDLIKNPLSSLKLTKITKQITSIALAMKENNSNASYIDIDTDISSSSNLDEYISMDSGLEASIITKLQYSIQEIKNSISIDEIKATSITKAVITSLKNLYKQSTYTTNTLANFKTLARKISDANILDSKLRAVSSYQLKKALSDTSLLPSFTDEKSNDLSDTLKDLLNSNETTFKDYLNEKIIDIKNISGFTLYDSNTYKQVLGDDNLKRRTYYTFSDKSNIAKAYTLAKDAYTNDVNDPVNAQIANGLARLGFSYEAFNQIEHNIYTPEEKKDAFKELGKVFLELNKNTEAAQAFTKEYEILLKQIATNIEGKLSSAQKNDLSYIIRNLAKSNNFEDTAENITGANTILAKVSSYSRYYSDLSRYANQKDPARSAINDYQIITNLIDDLASDIVTYDNDIEKGKKIYEQNIALIAKFPNNPKGTGIFHLSIIAIHGNIFGLDSSLAANKAFGEDNNPEGTNTEALKDLNAIYPVIYEGLSGNIQTAITNLKALKASNIDNALNAGMGAALFINNKKDELFNEYYSDTYYSSNNKDKLMEYTSALKPKTFMPTAMMIKIKSGNVELKDYLDRLRKLANTWYITDEDGDKTNNIIPKEAKKVYSQWNDNYSSRYGYLAIASMYKDINENQSAIDTINEAINKVYAFPENATERVDGLFNIWDAAKELGYEDQIDTRNILSALETSASNSTDIQDIIKVANILAINNKKDEAKILVEKAKTLLDRQLTEENDIKLRVQMQVKGLIGNYNSSNDFDTSIANAYLQLGTKNSNDELMAKDIIKEAYDAIKTLGSDDVKIETDTQYKELIHVVSAYAKINDLNSLNPILDQIQTRSENAIARVEAAKGLALFDAFSGTSIASIDSDGDGYPDFFNANASQSDISNSTLTLDPDIDNDGITDDTDSLPYDRI